MAWQQEQGANPAPATPSHLRPTVRRRWLRLAALALATGAAGLLAVPAAASTAGPASSGAAASRGTATQPAGARQRPWIAITSVTPGYEQPTGKVTISGIVANPGGSQLRGLSFQLWSWPTPLTSSEMDSYLTAPEPTGVDEAILGTQRALPSPVPAHGTEQWTLTLAANQVGMHTFGVYPLAVHLLSASTIPGIAGTPLDYARTFLPYWPGKQAAKTVQPAGIAWVWPLIDTPQQTVCQTLTSNELAKNVASSGRLGALLAAGQTATARQAMLTWAIDPALLQDLSVMSSRYRVTGTGGCDAGKQEPASSAARKWLAGVQAVATHQDFFTTPYADVDVAALAHAGMQVPELAAAFADGSLAARQTVVPGTQTKILGQAQRVTPTVGPIAWPAGGIADYGLIEALAHDGIRTVIMNGSLIHTPATVTTLPDGQGGELTVLRASNALTQILSTRRDQIPGLVPADYSMTPSARTQARLAAAFGKEQWFLAETAMIAAQAPAPGRSIVVAPPQHWNPLPGMAGALLDETVETPWLRPVTLAGLASTGSQTGQVSPKLPPEKRVTKAELSGSLLGKVARLDQQIRLLGSILTAPGHGYLSTAVDTLESSAWRGRRANERPAEQLLRSDMAYVLGRLRQVKLVGSSRITLGGQNGVVPVSISNGLDQPITVRLLASAPLVDHVTIGKFTSVITVQGHTQRTIKIPITEAQAGSTTLTLRLTNTAGKLLHISSSLTVVATHFGTLAIVIISIALVVFVLTATARAIRRGGPQDGGPAAEAEELDAMPSTRDRASAGDEPATVVSRGVDERQPAKEADEHASAPGTADRS